MLRRRGFLLLLGAACKAFYNVHDTTTLSASAKLFQQVADTAARTLISKMLIQALKASAWTWAAQREIKRANSLQPFEPFLPLPSHQRMLEQRQQRDRRQAFDKGSSRREQQRARRAVG